MASAVEDPELEGEEVDSGEEEEEASVSYPLAVQYCGVCTLPVEYCEFTAEYDKCKDWWQANFPDIYLRVIEQGAAELSLDAGGKKRQTRGGKALKKAKKKEVEKRITVARASRGKRKYVTVICGLTTVDIDLKKAAKTFGSRFACGSSVTGADEIVIQGDVTDDLIDFVMEKWPEVTDDIIEDIGDQKISKR